MLQLVDNGIGCRLHAESLVVVLQEPVCKARNGFLIIPHGRICQLSLQLGGVGVHFHSLAQIQGRCGIQQHFCSAAQRELQAGARAGIFSRVGL